MAGGRAREEVDSWVVAEVAESRQDFRRSPKRLASFATLGPSTKPTDSGASGLNWLCGKSWVASDYSLWQLSPNCGNRCDFIV